MNEKFRVHARLRLCVAAGLTGTILLAAACASMPAPTEARNAAKVAITNAEKADAGKYASAEVAEARQKLAMADSAVRAEDMILAEQLAEQSRVEAELASARTAAAKAAAINEEMNRGTDALNEEMQRAGDQL